MWKPCPGRGALIQAGAIFLSFPAFLTAGCSPRHSDNAVSSNNVEEQSATRTWHYNVRNDRIRKAVDHLAAMYNEDEDPVRDRTIVLTIQKLSFEELGVFFRGPMEGCPTVCRISYRSGDEVGAWLGQLMHAGDGIMIDEAPAALDVILRSRELIVELPAETGGQFIFPVEGLSWPPQTSSPRHD